MGKNCYLDIDHSSIIQAYNNLVIPIWPSNWRYALNTLENLISGLLDGYIYTKKLMDDKNLDRSLSRSRKKNPSYFLNYLMSQNKTNMHFNKLYNSQIY